MLAEWVVNGEAPLDLWAVDIRRFSSLHRDRDWVRERTLEAYGKHYTVVFPHEEYDSGRPAIVSPLYERLKARGAVFGSKLGWERPNWFADPSLGETPSDQYTYGRQNWFDAVGREHRACREAAVRQGPRFGIGIAEAFIARARELYARMFAPVADDLPQLTHLVFEPDGATPAALATVRIATANATPAVDSLAQACLPRVLSELEPQDREAIELCDLHRRFQANQQRAEHGCAA